MPKKDERIFPISISSVKSNFWQQRKIIAKRFNNPRLLKITLYSFRYWKATMKHHKTRNIIHVKELLLHRNIQTI